MSNRQIIAGGIFGFFVLLVGLGLVFLFYGPDSGEGPNKEHQTRGEKQEETGEKNEGRKNGFPPEPREHSDPTDGAEQKEGKGIVRVKAVNSAGKPVPNMILHLFPPEKNSLPGDHPFLTGRTGEQGLIQWQNISPGSGYAVGLERNWNEIFRFPGITISPESKQFKNVSEMSDREKKKIFQSNFSGVSPPELKALSGKFRVNPGETSRVQLTVETRSIIRGTVLNPEGNPAEEATVTISFHTHRHGGKEYPRGLYVGFATRQTPDTGMFRFFNPDEGDLMLSVSWQDDQGNIHLARRSFTYSRGRTLDLGKIHLGMGRSEEIQLQFTGPAAEDFEQYLSEKNQKVTYPFSVSVEPEDRKNVRFSSGTFPVKVPGSIRITGLTKGSLSVGYTGRSVEDQWKKRFPEYKIGWGSMPNGEIPLTEEESVLELQVEYRTPVQVTVRSPFVPETPVNIVAYSDRHLYTLGTVEPEEFQNSSGPVVLEGYYQLGKEVTLFAHSPHDSSEGNVYVEDTLTVSDPNQSKIRHVLTLQSGGAASLAGTIYQEPGVPAQPPLVTMAPIVDGIESTIRFRPDDEGQFELHGLPPDSKVKLEIYADSGTYERVFETGSSGSTRNVEVILSE